MPQWAQRGVVSSAVCSSCSFPFYVHRYYTLTTPAWLDSDGRKNLKLPRQLSHEGFIVHTEYQKLADKNRANYKTWLVNTGAGTLFTFVNAFLASKNPLCAWLYCLLFSAIFCFRLPADFDAADKQSQGPNTQEFSGTEVWLYAWFPLFRSPLLEIFFRVLDYTNDTNAYTWTRPCTQAREIVP